MVDAEADPTNIADCIGFSAVKSKIAVYVGFASSAPERGVDMNFMNAIGPKRGYPDPQREIRFPSVPKGQS